MIVDALVAIQGELKAPKDQKASRYRYRNIEDINEAVKPLAAKHGCAVTYTDRFDDGVCVSTCTLLGSDGSISADGCAYVNTDPTNMSIEQASGAASSYARKYAACGLFAIDSSENDPDRVNANMADAELQAAKVRLYQACKAYADRMGMQVEEVTEGVKKRPEYVKKGGSVEWLEMVTEELLNG